ncbi:MAG: hypothetical protein A2451_02575 [Bdellovibrionales bacterium RIFOXYC2_FULL_39_8]|nr:MAG: hypothetical protein A2404_07970 [Bdellovibrionales bacterium RIFOXYC1_FULL_39_130]OFZ73929.1 MAG: hypothetical protein A2451_02575 [Bdellovibrionales bacterium RIFOXYC2_FULL_39_8]
MKLIIILSLFITINCFALEIYSITEKISKPESVYYYGGAIYISNIDAESAGGSSAAKDGIGWITKTDANGKNSVKIFEGLSAPKGLRVYGDNLYIADIDEVVIGDLKTEKIIKKVKVPGAKFLNDLTVDLEGNVFVSDTIGSTIFEISKINSANPDIKNFVTSMKEAPNGLLVIGDELFVASWGQDITEKFQVGQLGSVIAINLKTKKIRYITKEPLGNLDGIEKFGNQLIVSAKMQDTVYRIDFVTGKTEVLLHSDRKTKTDNSLAIDAADIGFNIDENILLIPNMMLNRVTAVKI